MSAWPYKHRDDRGGVLEVVPGAEDGTAGIRTRIDRYVSVADPAGIVSALYAAAGKPEPAILGRPEVPDGGTGVNAFTVWRNADLRSVQVRTGNTSVALAPPVARLLASVLVAYADVAESEPDPAEVDELAAVLHQQAACGCAGGIEEKDREAARAVLRAGYRREAAR